MTGFILAIIPAFLLVFLGQVIRRRGVISDTGWRGIERLTYFVLAPALIVDVLSRADLLAVSWKLAIVLALGQVILGLIGLLARFSSRSRGPATGSIVQSNVRWNVIIALSVAGPLFGDQGLALVAISSAVLIPLSNILAVWGFIANADQTAHKRPNILKQMITNPFLIACAVGILIAAFQIALPDPISRPISVLSQAAIATGLLSAGAAINIEALIRAGSRTLFWSLVRLWGLPATVLLISMAMGVPALETAIAVICVSSPTAVNGYILSKELGGDATLSANLIAVQMTLAAITMPIVWFFFLQTGLFAAI